MILKERNFRFENIINIPAYKKITDTWNRIDNHLYGKRNNDFLLNLFFILKKLRKYLSNPYINPKFSPISNTEILQLKNKLEKINPRFKDLNIKIFNDDLIKIEHEKNKENLLQKIFILYNNCKIKNPSKKEIYLIGLLCGIF